jgi:hypothetical protein
MTSSLGLYFAIDSVFIMIMIMPFLIRREKVIREFSFLKSGGLYFSGVKLADNKSKSLEKDFTLLNRIREQKL